MLDAVLVEYLDSLTEREFDGPFLALLRAMGFEEIHFTHGGSEFGKDFIAKKRVAGELVQFAFQNKAGRISQGVWRSDVQPQVFEALTNGLSLPSFDRTLPRQVIVVTTGRLSGNAGPSVQAFNDETVSRIPGARRIEVWDQETLIPLLRRHGLEGMHPASSAGYREYAQFYELYGRLSSRTVTPREIERYSRQWLESPKDLPISRPMFRAVCEASILGVRLAALGECYLAMHAVTCALRAVWFHGHAAGFPEWAEVSAQACRELLIDYSRRYIQDVLAARAEGPFFCGGEGALFSYPVTCSRLVEAAGLIVLSGGDADGSAAALVREFINCEPGTSHPPSDNFAYSVVVATLAVLRSAKDNGDVDARKHVRAVAKWICDQYEKHLGLADLEADPVEEFSAFVLGSGRNQSYVATVLVDLAAQMGNAQLYADIVNDLLAVDAAPTCWVPQNTQDQYLLHGRDVLHFPNLEFTEPLPQERTTFHGEHLAVCAEPYLAGQRGRPWDLLAIAGVLRDRHFPTLWGALIKPGTQNVG